NYEITVDRQNHNMNNNNDNGMNIGFMEPGNPDALPPKQIDRKKENFLGILGGVGYNINHIIGAGIFNPDNIWVLVRSPGVILMFWILGGFISLLATLIYIELGIKALPKGIGEQRYIDHAFPNKPNLGHIFSFVVIIIILPGGIIADSYVCAQYLFHMFRLNSDPKQYFDKEYIALRSMSIAILAIITAYNMISNRLSVIINQVLAIIKVIAIFIISLVGLITLTESNSTNWSNIFNSPSAYVGAYSTNTIEELKEPKDQKLKYSNLISVGVSFVLYFLINAAFTTAVGHEFFNDENANNQTITFENSIALRFSYKLFNNNETGATFMSALVAISAFGSVGAMIFIYARIIKYAAETNFIPRFSYLFDSCHKRFGTPFNALIAQFIYCSLFLLLFFDPTKDLFEFFSETAQFLAMIFHGASAICLFIIKINNEPNDAPKFRIPKWIIVIYLILPFMEPGNPNPLPPKQIDRKKENFLGILGGVEYNNNHIIDAGIFNPDSIWIIVKSPGVILMFWILGGFISLLGTLIYIELGIGSLPKGIGEQRYIDYAFPNRPNLGHIFSFVVIIIILPGGIVADSFACAQYLFYIFFRKNPVPKQYFDVVYIALSLMSIAILALITGYTMRSNRISLIINQVLAIIKVAAIFIISLVGLITLTGSNNKNWNDVFNSPSASVGAYSTCILKILFVYEDTIEELEEPKDQKLKYSTIISVGVSFILYLLVNTAFTTAFGHEFFNEENVFNQTTTFDNSIALRFGYKLFNNNEIEQCLCLHLLQFLHLDLYARIIKYAAATKFIPKYSYLFDSCHKRFGTPFNALIAQFIYCSLFLLLFFDPTKDLFEFFSETSQYLAMIFHGASAICLLIIKRNNGSNFKTKFRIPKLIIVIYLILVSLIAITSFFPPAPGQLDYYIPYVVSVAATFLGGIIWRFRDYSENPQDSRNPEDSGSER
ncbi:38724_t:CDS:10, partial [Gigaspora margarita]